MKLKYKENEITVTESEIRIRTDDLNLAKRLKEEGIKVDMAWTLHNFLEMNKVTMIEDKKNLLWKPLKTICYVKEIEEQRTNFRYYLQSPGARNGFYANLDKKYDIGDFLFLEGVFETDDYYNSKKRSKLETIIKYEYLIFKVMKHKKVEFVKELKKEVKPRYELHLHTIHSKRDAHITHDELKEAFEDGILGALAITNHGINNCFPDSVHTFAKTKHKVIPAVEIYMVDDIKLEAEIKQWEQDNSSLFLQRDQQTDIIKRCDGLLFYLKEKIEAKDYEKGGLKLLNEEKKSINEELREAKVELKAIEVELKALEKTKPNLGDAKRYHATILLKTKNSIYKDEKYEFEHNEGIVELNRMITRANTLGLAEPVQFKWLGKRATVALSDLRAKRKHFIIGSACSLGTITDALIENNKTLAEEYIDLYDYLEVQPLHNNSYLMREEEWKERYPTKEELKALNHKIYDFAKKHDKKVCFTSDAHVINKESRFKRAMFKKSYISMINLSFSGENKIVAEL